jgi:hypothetical protein
VRSASGGGISGFVPGFIPGFDVLTHSCDDSRWSSFVNVRAFRALAPPFGIERKAVNCRFRRGVGTLGLAIWSGLGLRVLSLPLVCRRAWVRFDTTNDKESFQALFRNAFADPCCCLVDKGVSYLCSGSGLCV